MPNLNNDYFSFLGKSESRGRSKSRRVDGASSVRSISRNSIFLYNIKLSQIIILATSKSQKNNKTENTKSIPKQKVKYN